MPVVFYEMRKSGRLEAAVGNGQVRGVCSLQRKWDRLRSDQAFYWRGSSQRIGIVAGLCANKVSISRSISV